MDLSVILFFILAVGAIASALFTITRRNPVASAMSLVVHFLCLSGLYLTLQAQLLAVLQILVYAGAIMVLVLFVIMLLNLGSEEQLTERLNHRSLLAIVFAAVLTIQFVSVFVFSPAGSFRELAPQAETIGTVETIGTELFTTYLFPFEAVSLLLLAAILGAIILAKRKLET